MKQIKHKKRICLICATPLTLHFFFRQHVISLSREFDVTIIFNRNIDSYIKIDDLPARQISIPLQRKMSPAYDLFCLCALTLHFMLNRYDAIWAIAPKAGLIATMAGWLVRISKRIFVFQGEVWATKRGLGRTLLKTIDRVIAATATNVLSVSEGEKEFLIKEGIIARAKIDVLSPGSISGVDAKMFVADPSIREQMRDSFGFTPDARVCLFLGRLSRDKGLLDLASAFRNARERGYTKLKLLIAGPDEDNMSGDLHQCIAPYVDDVKFLPFIKDTIPIFSACDVFCLPSYREGFPISILEAAAMSVPTIGSDIYGIADAIIDQKTGVLFKSRNVNYLTQCLIDFHNNIENYRTMGENARTRVVKDFNSEDIISNYTRYIRNLAC